MGMDKGKLEELEKERIAKLEAIRAAIIDELENEIVAADAKLREVDSLLSRKDVLTEVLKYVLTGEEVNKEERNVKKKE